MALEQARRLVQRGHQVSVLTSRLAGDPPILHDEGFPVYRVSVANFLERRSIPYPIFSWSLFSLLARLVPAHDVVLVHSHIFASSVASVFIAKRYKRPIVLLQHNPFVRYRFPWNLVENGADRLLGRYSLRSATSILAVSEHTRRYVKGLVHRQPVGVLYNGVDTQRFTPSRSAEEKRLVRERLGLPLECFLMFTVRRLVFRNGLDTLLEASARLKNYKDIVAVIGGSGPERRTMEGFIRNEGLENVRLAGFVPDALLPDFYRASDAFILPTRTGEGFGLVLLEAFASGIPVIATQGGGQDEVVDEGRTGLLVPPAEPGALADAILRLRNDPEHVKLMGRAARAKAAEMNWEKNVELLEKTLVGASCANASRRAI